LSIGLDEKTPDHVTISRTRRLIDGETHQRVFTWVLERLAQGGLVKGKTIGVDSTTLEANAAMKSIVRRDTGESYMAYLKRLAEAEGIEAEDAAALLRMDRKRKKKTSNEDWKSPSDEEAEITKLKDGRTALAYKAENAVDMETGAIVAVTTHSGAAADTATVKETVIEAGIAVAGLIAEKTPEGKYEVHPEGVQEMVADKGYHSNDVMVGLAEMEVRTYVAEPDRGIRNWDGKEAEKEAVYGNRRRIEGERGKRLQRQRGERIERNFAHQFDSGGLDRLYVRNLENVHKKLLIQAAACNLALLMRSTYGSGKPRAAHDRAAEAILMILAVIRAVKDIFVSASAHFHVYHPFFRPSEGCFLVLAPVTNRGV
jgi:transposase